MAATNSALGTEYAERMREYGPKAMTYKRWYQASWYSVTLSVWATLLLAIASLAWPDMAGLAS